jgi:uncharacterized coiled-coil DUF342 family protein
MNQILDELTKTPSKENFKKILPMIEIHKRGVDDDVENLKERADSFTNNVVNNVRPEEFETTINELNTSRDKLLEKLTQIISAIEKFDNENCEEDKDVIEDLKKKATDYHDEISRYLESVNAQYSTHKENLSPDLLSESPQPTTVKKIDTSNIYKVVAKSFNELTDAQKLVVIKLPSLSTAKGMSGGNFLSSFTKIFKWRSK